MAKGRLQQEAAISEMRIFVCLLTFDLYLDIIKEQGDTCANKHLLAVEPDGCHKHTNYTAESLALKHREPSAATDGSLLFISKHVPNLGNSPIDFLKSYMHHLLWETSREGYIYASIPHSQDDRQPSFTVHRLQRMSKTQLRRWIHGIYYTRKYRNVNDSKTL